MSSLLLETNKGWDKRSKEFEFVEHFDIYLSTASMGYHNTYISTEDLKTHNKPGDLWISIQGKVYNVSEWINDHPGGELPILNLVGQDVTNAFFAFHPGTAWEYLDQFLIGYLKDYQVSEVSKDYRKLVTMLTKHGLFEKKGHGVFISLCSIVFMLALSIYGVLWSKNVWVHLFCGGLMGFMWIQSGWLGHDSGHYNIMWSNKYNKLVQILSVHCLSGIGSAWWKLLHNGHHLACNNLEFDPDLQHMPFFAVSSGLFNLTSYFHNRKMSFDNLTRYLVSYQHWTFYPVILCFARLNLFVESFLLLLSKRKVVNRVQDLICLLVFWTWYPLVVSCLPSWGERVMFLTASFMVTGIQQVQFCLNHFSSEVYVGVPSGSDWVEKQTGGSLNITCPCWMDWFHGGLQFQIEHHLFPRLPRCNFRLVSPLVRELCNKHGLPYATASFCEANVMTIRTLRTAALEAWDFSNPVPKCLVWEAVNTYG